MHSYEHWMMLCSYVFKVFQWFTSQECTRWWKAIDCASDVTDYCDKYILSSASVTRVTNGLTVRFTNRNLMHPRINFIVRITKKSFTCSYVVIGKWKSILPFQKQLDWNQTHISIDLKLGFRNRQRSRVHMVCLLYRYSWCLVSKCTAKKKPKQNNKKHRPAKM